MILSIVCLSVDDQSHDFLKEVFQNGGQLAALQEIVTKTQIRGRHEGPRWNSLDSFLTR